MTTKRVKIVILAMCLIFVAMLFIYGSGKSDLAIIQKITNPKKGLVQAEIDWIDFVNIGKVKYQGADNAVIADARLITDKIIGEVAFNVSQGVTNPHYVTQPGDASYLSEGTELYAVEGYDPSVLIAAKDEYAVQGYRLYVASENRELGHKKFDELSQDKISKIDIYRRNYQLDHVSTLKDEELGLFMQALRNGEDKPGVSINSAYPAYYRIVMYSEEAMAYGFDLVDDGGQMVFYPWESRIVGQEIRQYFQ